MVRLFFYFLMITLQCASAFSANYTEDLDDYRRNPHKLVNQVHVKTGYKFQNPSLLSDVFTHHSHDKNSRFRQLEFLGDTIINAVVGISTFNIGKDLETLHEGVKERVNNKFLAKQFKKLGLSLFVRANSGSDRDTIAADTFEALIGAMQLDFARDDQISPDAQKLIVSALGINPLSSSQVVSRPRNLPQEENILTRRMSNHTDEASLLVAGAIGAGVATLAKGLWDGVFGAPNPDYYNLYKFHERQHIFHERQHSFYKKAFLGLCCLTVTMSIYPTWEKDLGQLLYWGYYMETAYVGYYVCRIVALHAEGLEPRNNR